MCPCPERSFASAKLTSSLLLNRSEPVPLCIFRVLETIEVPVWPGITTEHFTCGSVEPKIGDEGFGEPFYGEFRRAISGVRNMRPHRGPEPRAA